jgi:two-component system capsular synthesis sensor histidine kinase RcsC
MQRAIGTHGGDNGPWEAEDGEPSRSMRSPLAGVDAIAAAVHEVQNALASALFSVDVARRTADPSERSRALTTIERAIDRARSMLSVLTNPAERFHVRCATFSTSAVLEEVAALLRPRCEAHGVRLVVQSDAGLNAYGDADRIVQVLTNLVLNALDAVLALAKRAPDRGSISIVCRARDAHSVEFVVIDDGIGMSPETLAHLFEPGFTTHPRAEGTRQAGTGLGMSVSRQLVLAMGGSMDVHSTEGHGTEVVVILPRDDVGLAPASIPTREHDEFLDGLRLLVVDDEPSIRELLVTALSLRGATVEAAPNSEIASQLLASQPFDVALVDETLGTNDCGATLVDEMLDRFPSTTVLLMTGAPTLDYLPLRVARCLLRKPFSLDEAVRTILRARKGKST